MNNQYFTHNKTPIKIIFFKAVIDFPGYKLKRPYSIDSKIKINSIDIYCLVVSHGESFTAYQQLYALRVPYSVSTARDFNLFNLKKTCHLPNISLH